MSDRIFNACLLIRHGKTDWTANKRIQGRSDIALSDEGRAQVDGWSLPDNHDFKAICSSPLLRATQSAIILAEKFRMPAPSIDERLIEMDWGAFEGRSLTDLRAEDPKAMAALEAQGSGFRAPGGERPLDVAERLRSFLDDLDEPTIAVCHKGVLHAALILALNWKMDGKPPIRFTHDDGLMLLLDHQSRIRSIDKVALQ